MLKTISDISFLSKYNFCWDNFFIPSFLHLLTHMFWFFFVIILPYYIGLILLSSFTETKIFLSKVYPIKHRMMIISWRRITTTSVIIWVIGHVKGRGMRGSIAGIALLLLVMVQGSHRDGHMRGLHEWRC